MTTYETPLELPPAFEHKQVAKAAEELRRLEAEHRTSAENRHALEDARAEAAEVDRQSFATALRTGKGDPGTPATEEADRAILTARRREEALWTAAAQARGEFVDRVRAHRDELHRMAEERVAERRDALAGAAAALEAAHRGLAEALADRAWLAGFPQRARWQLANLRLSALVAPSGEPYTVDQVLQALAGLAEAP